MEIEIKNVCIRYEAHTVFEDLSTKIPKGAKLAISGISGKGKSSLLNFLAGFVKASEGQLLIDGQEIHGKAYHEMRKRIAWLPQDISLQVEQVKDLLLYPFTFAINKVHFPDDERIESLMKSFQLDKHLLTKRTNEISGGQKQRILLMSTVLLNKEVILLDEPTSALDEQTKQTVADYFLGLKNTTVIAATHDPYWVANSDTHMNLNNI